MKEPDINEFLKILSAVIDHGSFSKAASELEISQVTVSKKISELEDFIGEALIERTSKGIRRAPDRGSGARRPCARAGRRRCCRSARRRCTRRLVGPTSP